MIPLRKHLGTVTFTAKDGATTMRWQVDFTAYLGFGWILPLALRAAINKMAKHFQGECVELSKAAAQSAAANATQ